MYRKLIKGNASRIAASVSLFLLVSAGQVLADVAVVANKGVGVDSITASEAKKIWLGKSKSLGGASVKLADLSQGNASRDHFYLIVVKKMRKNSKRIGPRSYFLEKERRQKYLRQMPKSSSG